GKKPTNPAIDRAVAQGVAYLRTQQRADGTWPFAEMGATALAGLTLLECDVTADDPAVVKAAQHVREAGVGCTHTYSLALGILCLDRLGAPEDVPLLEAWATRLLAGQGASGGWSYQCPAPDERETRRLSRVVRLRKPPGERTDPPRPAGMR